MDEEIIVKIFDNIISKHSDFLYNIEGTLREITDNKEEYKTLKEDIWQFYKETKKSDHEELIMKGTDGSFFENRGGNDTSVGITDEMKKYAIENQGKVIYSIHNHPNQSDYPSSCFQSINDVVLMINYGVKYGITVGADGIMILKNNNKNSITSNETFSFYVSANDSCRKSDENISKQFNEEYKSEISELKKKYNITNFSKLEDIEKYREEESPLYQEFLTKNFENIASNLEEEFKKNDVDIGVYHVPKKPRLY